MRITAVEAALRRRTSASVGVRCLLVWAALCYTELAPSEMVLKRRAGIYAVAGWAPARVCLWRSAPVLEIRAKGRCPNAGVRDKTDGLVWIGTIRCT